MIVRSFFALISLVIGCTSLALAQSVTVKLPDGGSRTTESTKATVGETRTATTYTGTRDAGGNLKSEVTQQSAIKEPEGGTPSTTDTVQTRTYHIDGSSTAVTVTNERVRGGLTFVSTKTTQLDTKGIVTKDELSVTIVQPGKRDSTSHQNLVTGFSFRPLVKPAPAPAPIADVLAPDVPHSQVGVQRSIIMGYINEIKARLKTLTANYHPGNTTLLTACKADGVQAYGITKACGADFFLQFDQVTPYYTEHLGRLATVLSVLRFNFIFRTGYLTAREMSYYASGMQAWRPGNTTIVAAFSADIKLRVRYAHLQDRYNEAFEAYSKLAQADPTSSATKEAQTRWYAVLDQVNAFKPTNDYNAAGRYRVFSGLIPSTLRKGQQLQPISPPITNMPQLKPV